MKETLFGKELTAEHTTQDRCIWMTAGVVSFKLCPFSFDCEHCEFDRVMRHQFKGRGSPLQRADERNHSSTDSRPDAADTFFTFTVGELPEDCYVHLAHVWVRPQDTQTWKMGIDQLLSYVLPPPLGIEFYGCNKELTQNGVLGKIVTTVGTIFLISPLSGTLVSENPGLAVQPHLLQEDPLGEGWLAQFKWVENSSELREFYTGSEAKQFLKEEACHLRHVLKYRGIEVSKAGQTLLDGGNTIKYLNQILPPQSCLELSKVLIAMGKSVW